MAIWLVRSYEYESDFFGDIGDVGYIYCLFASITGINLSCFEDREAILRYLEANDLEAPRRRLINFTSQISAFSFSMQAGDLVVVPRASSGYIAIGKITGAYEYVEDATSLFLHHRRTVKWLRNDIELKNLDQPTRNSLGAYSSICRLHTNNIEGKITELLSGKFTFTEQQPESADDTGAVLNTVELARQSVIERITQEFPGHHFARLVGAVFEAQGYKTHVSKAGPDGGVDILVGTGPLGFGEPRIVVQVKAQVITTDRKALDELMGVMKKFNAKQCLFVSRSGFNRAVEREIERQFFFEVRLWSMSDLINEIYSCYENLPTEIKSKLRFRNIWAAESDMDSHSPEG